MYGCSAFVDLKACFQGLEGKDVDLVVVAVPPSLQPMLVEELLSSCSPRMLLLEKPVAPNAESAERLRSVCLRRPDLVVAVNYIRRFLPVVLQLQAQMQTGTFGQLLHGHLVYGKGLLSNGSHFVNLAEAWLGPLHPGCVLNPAALLQALIRRPSPHPYCSWPQRCFAACAEHRSGWFAGW